MDTIVEPEDCTVTFPSNVMVKIIELGTDQRREVIGTDGEVQIHVGRRIAVPLTTVSLPTKGWFIISCPKLGLKGYWRDVKSKT